LLVAHQVEEWMDDGNGPVVVAGDFNDVPWSYVTLMMRRISGLLDPRIGRGPYNTFHTRYPFFRCPIDHVLHSAHFSLRRLERGPDVGSDHYPFLADLQLEPHAVEVHERPYANDTMRRHARQEIYKSVRRQ
jgi:endonuclease/exonuclease/phosphatase (EEP) superfamily protein YafD